MHALDNPFWTYSLAAYAQDGVAAECLALQDRAGLDVNLLLLCCWHGTRGTRIDEGDMRRAIKIAEDWTGPVVAPIRAVRRHLKPLAGDPDIAALRKQAAALELAAERIQQARLFAETGALPEGSDGPGRAAAANLCLYLSLARPDADRPIQDSLLKLLRAAFPDASEADIVSAPASPAPE